MTTIKFLSAGLIAAAVFATPVMAREYSAASRHAAEEVNAHAVHYGEGHVGVAMPHVGAFIAAPPDGGEGESCDVGDTPHIC
jgi:hypothetical protein